MAEPTAAHARDLGDYVRLVRRRWAWVAVSVVVGVSVALLYLTTAQATYQSSAKVLVESTGSTTSAVGDRTNDTINLDTEAQLVKSAPVSTRAVEMLGSPLSPVALARRVTVSVPPNTTVMVVSFSAPSGEAAQEGANTFARAYLEDRRETAEAALAKDVGRLQDRIEQTSNLIQETTVAIAALSGPKERADRAFLVARRSTLSSELASYNAQLAPLIGAEVNPGTVIQEAQQPRTPVDPNPLLVIPAGLMAGLVLGLGFAAVRERTDKRIHDAADVERLFGLVPLSSIHAGRRGRFHRVIHDVRATYHSLRANGPDREVLMLVGPDAPSTAEHLAYSLALTAARSGSTAAYLARPGSTVLHARRRSDAERVGALAVPDYQSLGMVADGEFRAANLREELRELAATHEFLVLGLPNDDPSVDVPLLGRHVNVAVVVVRLGITRRDTLASVLTDLTKSGVDRVFAVIVDFGGRGARRGSVLAEDAFAEATERTGPRPLPLAHPSGAPEDEDEPAQTHRQGDRTTAKQRAASSRRPR